MYLAKKGDRDIPTIETSLLNLIYTTLAPQLETEKKQRKGTLDWVYDEKGSY